MCKLGALHYHFALHYHGADNHPGATRHPSMEGNFLNFFDQGKEFKLFPSVEGWQAKPDGVVALSRGVFPRSGGVVALSHKVFPQSGGVVALSHKVFPCNLPRSHAPRWNKKS